MNNKTMSGKTAKGLVIFSAFFLILLGISLYKLFDYQGYGDKKGSSYVNYNIKDYIETTPVVLSDYNDVFSSINVSKVTIKNLDSNLINTFMNEEDELISYISKYYDEIKKENDYTTNNTVVTFIKTGINSTVLSVYYQMNFNFNSGIKNYVVTTNIDLRTNKILTVDDLLLKYNYDKDYIAEKIFNDDVLIGNNEVAIDKNTNISLTRSDIERKKNEYISRIVDDFDNIIKVYIDNGSLVLTYNKKELNDLFFENDYSSELKTKYLK